MRVTKILRYLRLIFILFIYIFIYLKVSKNRFSSIKLNTKIQDEISQRKPMSNIENKIISFHEIRTSFEVICIKTS